MIRYLQIEIIVKALETALPMLENKDEIVEIIAELKKLIFFGNAQASGFKPMSELTDGELSLLLHAISFNKENIINNPNDNINDGDCINTMNSIVNKLQSVYNARII